MHRAFARTKQTWYGDHVRCYNKSVKNQASTVLFGDSIVRNLCRYPDVWRKFEEQNIVNCGIGGDKVSNILWRIEKTFLSPSVSVGLIHCGINDIIGAPANAFKPHEIAENAISCGLKLRERHPSISIVIMGVLPTDAVQYCCNDKINHLNNILRDMSALHNMAFITTNEFWEEDTINKKYFWRDGLHLNKRGCKLLASIYLNAIKLNQPSHFQSTTKETVLNISDPSHDISFDDFSYQHQTPISNIDCGTPLYHHRCHNRKIPPKRNKKEQSNINSNFKVDVKVCDEEINELLSLNKDEDQFMDKSYFYSNDSHHVSLFYLLFVTFLTFFGVFWGLGLKDNFVHSSYVDNFVSCASFFIHNIEFDNFVTILSIYYDAIKLMCRMSLLPYFSPLLYVLSCVAWHIHYMQFIILLIFCWFLTLYQPSKAEQFSCHNCLFKKKYSFLLVHKFNIIRYIYLFLIIIFICIPLIIYTNALNMNRNYKQQHSELEYHFCSCEVQKLLSRLDKKHHFSTCFYHCMNNDIITSKIIIMKFICINIIFLILFLSGDLELNPGPNSWVSIKDPNFCNFLRVSLYMVFSGWVLIPESDDSDDVVVSIQDGFQQLKLLYGEHYEANLAELKPLQKNITRFLEDMKKWSRNYHDDKSEYCEIFSPKNWKNLNDSTKKKHTVFCKECPKQFGHGMFPSKTNRFSKKRKDDPKYGPKDLAKKAKKCKKSTLSESIHEALDVLNDSFSQHFGVSFEEGLVKSSVLAKKTSPEEKRVFKKNVVKEVVSKFNNELDKTVVDRVLGSRKSLQFHDKERKMKSFENVMEAKKRTLNEKQKIVSGIKKPKNHVGVLSSYQINTVWLEETASTWTDETKVIWKHIGDQCITTKNGTIPANSGQIAKQYLCNKENNDPSFSFKCKDKGEKGKEIIRRQKKKLYDRISVPTDVPSKKSYI